MGKTISTRLVIEGEQEYRNSIKNINSSLKELQSELKSSEAEFKGNEDSMEALTSKADILGRIYEEQSNKVAELQSALEQAQSQHQSFADVNDDLTEKLQNAKDRLEELKNSSEDTTEEEARLQEEIANLNQQLEDNDQQLQKSANAVTNWQTQLNNAQADLYNTRNNLDEVNAKMGETSQKSEQSSASIGAMTGALGSLGTAGGLANSVIGGLVGGGLAGIISIAPQIVSAIGDIVNSFSEANAIISQATGATGDALKELNDIAYETWLAVDENDLTTVATAVGEINTRLDASGEELAYLTEQFEIYADVTGVDVKNAVVNVSQAMHRWNLSNEDCSFLLDKLVVAGQKTGISVDELSGSLASNAAVFQTMGFTLDESIALLSTFEKQGIQSSTILMGLKKAAKEFTDEGKNAKDGIQDLIDRIANASSEQAALNIAYDYFNTRSAPEFVSAVQNGTLELDGFVEALDNSRGAMEQTDEANDTVSEKWAQVWKNALSQIQIAVETVAALMSGDIEAAQGYATQMAETFGTTGQTVSAFVDLEAAAFESWKNKASESIESTRSGLAALQEAYDASYKTAYENITAELSLFKEMDNTATTSVDDMIGALQSQIDYMDDYAENLKKAIEYGVDEGLIEKLSDGSEESAAILRGIAEDGGKNIKELNTKLAEVEKGKEEFAKRTAEMETDFSETATQLVNDANEMVLKLNKEAEAYEAGHQTMVGLRKGLLDMKDEVVSTYIDIANAGIKAYKTKTDQHSPSRVFADIGRYDVEGLIQGINSEQSKAVQTYEDLAKATLGGYSSMADKLYNASLNAPSISNYEDNGYNDSRSFVMNVNVASASESDMQEVYKYISTNFAMAQGGRI